MTKRALAFLNTLSDLYVIKTDGLAAGKGVVVTDSLMDAREAVRSYLSGEAFGDAGRTLVIEEGLTGPELSLLVVCNGDPDGARRARAGAGLQASRRRRSRTEHAVAWVRIRRSRSSDRTVDDVMTRAVRPTLHWLARQGVDYRGVLYAGMMLTPDGPKVIEYNVRFGDPECQVVLPRFAGDLAELLRAAASGEPDLAVDFADDACVTVVLAAEGYPTDPRTGEVITGLDAASNTDGVVVFHAGTARRDDGALVTAGGRVLDVTATGPTDQRRARVYDAVGRIGWPGMQFRRDIAIGRRSMAARVAPAAKSARPASSPHAGRDERALDATQIPVVLGWRHEALRAPRLPARRALRDRMIGPVLGAVGHPEQPFLGSRYVPPRRVSAGGRAPLIDRYSLPEIAGLFTDEARFRTWLEVEVLATEAWAKLGVVPAADAAAIRERADFDLEAIRAREAVTDHETAAFVDVVQERIGGPAAKWVHYGLTSYDVVDTGMAVTLVRATDPGDRGRRRARSGGGGAGARAPRHADGRPYPRHPRRADHLRQQARALGAAAAARPRAPHPCPRRDRGREVVGRSRHVLQRRPAGRGVRL